VTWLRVDDAMLDHPKWVRAVRFGGSHAIHLWLALATWSAKHLTDGVIPNDMVATVRGPQRRHSAALSALVRSELVHVDGQGTITLHDFTRYNPSRLDILSERERKSRNKRNSRVANTVTGDAKPEVSDDRAPSRPVPARPVPDPSPSHLEFLSEPAEPATDSIAIVRDVFNEWQRVHSHPIAKLDPKRIGRIRSALKLRGPEELKQAIRGALKDDWLMGRDPKSPRKYDGLETILRDSAQIERLIDLETGKTKPGGYRPTAAGASRQTDEGVDPWAFHDKTRK
jgi:hypothetical protein